MLIKDTKVAEILTDLFGDCACDYCGIDEWLPMVCDYKDAGCPHITPYGCWLQFLKHLPEKEKVKGDYEQ